EHQPLMRGEVTPNGRADEDQQGGSQRHGEGKHQMGCDEREGNECSIDGYGCSGEDQASRASELKKEPGDQPGYEQRYQRTAGCAELVEPVVGHQHIQDVEMDHRAGDCLSCGQEQGSSRDRVWKRYDNVALEPLGEPIALLMLDGVQDG